MQKILNYKKEIFSFCCYLLLVFLLVYFVVMPKLGSINNQMDEIQKEKIIQQKNSEKLQEIPQLEKQATDLRQNSELFETFVGTDNLASVGLIKNLEGLATETDNQITISWVEKDKVQGAKVTNRGETGKSEKGIAESLPVDKYLKFNLELIGNYNSIQNFLLKLENMHYLSQVINLRIVQATKEIGQTNNVVGTEQVNLEQTQSSTQNLAATLEVIFYQE